MNAHVQRYHFARYQELLGKAPKPRMSCPRCNATVSMSYQLNDHLLKVHGVISDEIRKDASKLSRAKVQDLQAHLNQAVQKLMELNMRLREVEARLQSQALQGTGLLPFQHGLRLRTQAPANPLTDLNLDQAIAAVRATLPPSRQSRASCEAVLLARRFCEVQKEFDQEVDLPSGARGNFMAFVQEVEV